MFLRERRNGIAASGTRTRAREKKLDFFGKSDILFSVKQKNKGE